MLKLEDIQPGITLEGIEPSGLVAVVSCHWLGTDALELSYKTAEEDPHSIQLTRIDEERLKIIVAAEPIILAETAKEKLAQRIPVVGIGASAGGLAAFEAFFSGMPPGIDSKMAFVVIQHLAPDHKSILSEIIARYTRMHVYEVENDMPIQANSVYVIPPNRDMTINNGALQLQEPSSPRYQRLPIDYFFHSLAADQQEYAICIILSGTGSDGTLGLHAIKGENGLVLVQLPESAEYDAMPRNAIDTGLADFILPPKDMLPQIIAYVARAFSKEPPVLIGSNPIAKNMLKKIFTILSSQTNHDFSLYKPTTINRRIERRMTVNKIASPENYVVFLQKNPAEIEALFHDLLIGVTKFFRDYEVFPSIEQHVIPRLFEHKDIHSVIRIWVAGCSTGEEPYSLAMLIQEHLETHKKSFKILIFATDIDSRAIAAARSGRYPANIAADISAERLQRFFKLESDSGNYIINKIIRDMLVFSEHSIIRDPPFSKLDLISCRNLLIYLNSELQKKVITIFHYALNPGGFLILGTSETTGECSDLFNVIDRKAKIFQRCEDSHHKQRGQLGQFLPPVMPMEKPKLATTHSLPIPRHLPLSELTEQTILQHLALSAILINSQGDILYQHGRSGMYLELAPGAPSINNILKMARNGLHHELTIALHKVKLTKKIVAKPGIKVESNGHFALVNLVIRPVESRLVAAPEKFLYLVILEEAPPIIAAPAQLPLAQSLSTENLTEVNESIQTLKQKLRIQEEYLQTANEELETSNEELKSSNEEMQSVNEEMQSTNEELETSKEELQSVNEELSTVNAELQTKIVDLSQANNDLNNLLAGTGIATLFINHELLIQRFTPTAKQIINLIPSDIGRPVAHIVSNLLGYHRLVEDTRLVLDNLMPIEVDVQTIIGRWYTMRITPYRTLTNVIEGVVITFVDFTERKHTEQALQESETRFRILTEWTPSALIVHRAGFIIYANPAALKLLGTSSGQTLIGKSIVNLVHPDSLKGLPTWSNEPDQGIDTIWIQECLLKLDGTSFTAEIQTRILNFDGIPACYTAIQTIHIEDQRR